MWSTYEMKVRRFASAASVSSPMVASGAVAVVSSGWSGCLAGRSSATRSPVRTAASTARIWSSLRSATLSARSRLVRRRGGSARRDGATASCTTPSNDSASGASPASRNRSSSTSGGAGDTSTVAASRRNRIPGSPAFSTPVSTASSSHRRYVDAAPIRSTPCRRATSSTRYSSGCGTGVRECSANQACSCSAVRPRSSARRIDASLNRNTPPAPCDSGSAIADSSMYTSRTSAPGATAVRSACSNT